ncbi:hypothetical protein EDB83DRAFT_2551970 [Lactarius deliciosus]|nr:hypothetical protein EDB83DRAFT_2551970 [Lactarius deliciosus]
MRQPTLIAMTLLMLVLSVVATPRPLKQAKIKRGDLNDRDDDYKKHKPSKVTFSKYGWYCILDGTLFPVRFTMFVRVAQEFDFWCSYGSKTQGNRLVASGSKNESVGSVVTLGSEDNGPGVLGRWRDSRPAGLDCRVSTCITVSASQGASGTELYPSPHNPVVPLGEAWFFFGIPSRRPKDPARFREKRHARVVILYRSSTPQNPTLNSALYPRAGASHLESEFLYLGSVVVRAYQSEFDQFATTSIWRRAVVTVPFGCPQPSGTTVRS